MGLLNLNENEKGTRPQSQLGTVQEQHKGPCSILQGASVTLHHIILGVGGTIYYNHTLEPLMGLGLHFQRVKKLASKLHVHSVNCAAKLVHTRHTLSALLSTLIRRRFQVKPVTLLILIANSVFPLVKEF
jgi:hypothetical protein